MTYSPIAFGLIGKGSSRQNKTSYQNGTGITITAAAPVATDSASKLLLVDVTDESTVESMVGLASSDIPSAANGEVVHSGRMEEIPLGLGFAIRDIIYVDHGGTLTNVKPSIGVGSWVTGNFVVLVGVVVKNQFDPTKQDIQLFLELIGQL